MRRLFAFFRAVVTDVFDDDLQTSHSALDAVIGVVSILGILLALGAVGEGII